VPCKPQATQPLRCTRSKHQHHLTDLELLNSVVVPCPVGCKHLYAKCKMFSTMEDVALRMDVGGSWYGREHQGELQAGFGSLCGPSQGAVGAGMAWPGGSGCQRHLLDLCCHQCPHERHSRSAAECKPLKYVKKTIPLIPTRTTGLVCCTPAQKHTCTTQACAELYCHAKEREPRQSNGCITALLLEGLHLLQ